MTHEQRNSGVFVWLSPDVNGGNRQLSTGGGSAPLRRSPSRGSIYVVQVHPGPSFPAEPPRPPFAIPDRARVGGPTGGTFAVTPGDR